MSKELRLLFVFARNPELGKVKTRLARTIGDDGALIIYRALLERVAQVTSQVDASKAIYYSEFIDDVDQFDSMNFAKHVQEGDGLGERMKNAFNDAIERGFVKSIIVGSDCYELDPTIIEKAFDELDNHDVVIGPAKDGGYYLLGMKELHPQLFENKNWGTSDVLLDTILDVKELGLSYAMMDTLTDVDSEEDLGELKELLETMNAMGRDGE